MPTTFFLTGATGFLGTQIARQILLHSDADLVVLVRAAQGQPPEERLRRAWWDWPDLRAGLNGRVRVLAGDVTRARLGLTAAEWDGLARRVTHILHAAADIRMFAPLSELRRVNVDGTARVLELAQAAAGHGLAAFGHISTAYVSGGRMGEVAETDLDARAGFRAPYEQSKYEAELLVRGAHGLPWSIYRPAMISGDSRSGVIQTFNTLYYPLRLYLTGRLRGGPLNPHLRVNFVPVDYVAVAAVRLALDPRAVGQTFHLVPALNDLPTLSEVTQFTRGWAAREMGLRLAPAVFLPPLGLGFRGAGWVAALAGRDLAPLLRLLPYFQRQAVYLRANSDRLLGPYPFNWREVFAPLLAYAVGHSFWGRTPRTVYEQVLFRLQSRSKPLRYFDLTDGQLIGRSAAELRAEILCAVNALRALGIRPGERVGLVGLNSTGYFASFVACGLSGAVAAPFYSSSPPADLAALLRESGVRILLVGAPEVLRRLDEIDFEGRVVSFCRAAPNPAPRRPVLSWADFLALGAGGDFVPGRDGPALDDAAVVYYTSGTTGQPRGMLFRHEQLRWLAETLAGMYPWRERNRWGAYLSYLPMNHVVEGILANFSPYYVPAALDLYYLESFDALPWALRKARPVIFFSVPRFFEKVRGLIAANPLAKGYARLAPGALRRGLGWLLRRGLLRKSGLDRCRQIIVGSAASAAELLGFYHDLGIEVHDAYGLTEAPLVTMNRLGRNQLGTLGEPLPETEIRIGADGVVQVRGPQVAAAAADPNGWLETGDLGALTEAGCLTLHGRKKDLIITSYAKKVSPAGVETALRGLAGVAEALMVGEARPYCAALLWLAEGEADPDRFARIDAGIAAINARLAGPEQVKRWVVLAGELSVANGDLTGSLKVRRAVVTARMDAVIAALYAGDRPPGALHSAGMARGEAA